MKYKTLTIIFAILAVVCYTLAVINFSEGNVVSGISNILIATSDALMAYAMNKVGNFSSTVADAAFNLAKLCEKFARHGVKVEVVAEPDDEEDENPSTDSEQDEDKDNKETE